MKPSIGWRKDETTPASLSVKEPFGSHTRDNGLAKFPIPQPGVRHQQLTIGCDARLSCKVPLFGSICATIVQPRVSPRLAKKRGPSVYRGSAETFVKRCQWQPLAPRKIQINRVISGWLKSTGRCQGLRSGNGMAIGGHGLRHSFPCELFQFSRHGAPILERRSLVAIVLCCELRWCSQYHLA